MNVKLLTNRHLKFLSLKGDCAGSSESTLIKMPHCWKSHVTAHFILQDRNTLPMCPNSFDGLDMGYWNILCK